ncbi:ribosome-associated translation inhibitor RaiA [Candidatus Saccharibacteria bacterium]|nr:ribosome-associated translation inhibitor RaiA [Candidatus Saccharibacteria bacterium]HOR23165.1 ribosome-associated translation inhibitor RaiA [Candidatus Saccharibacteria bacterium]
MISNLEISAVRTEKDEDIRKYARRKIGRLDLYMSRHARKSVKAEVVLREEKIKARALYTVEVVLTMPGETISAKETTVNMYAAIDIVEEKLKSQLRRYKSTFSMKRGSREAIVRRLLGKIVPKRK